MLDEKLLANGLCVASKLYFIFCPKWKKFNGKGMSSACSTLVNNIVIRRDPGLALECLEITTLLIRSILGISTSLCLFCSVGWYMLLLELELFYSDLSKCGLTAFEACNYEYRFFDSLNHL